jgi:hypothetical protein
VEDKPEVKKAGGVYYTPTYIVGYIVKNTMGKLLEGKTPRQINTLRVLDPACGSGSFLLGAYQYLLDWHQEWYAKHDPEKHARGRNPKIFRGPGGDGLSVELSIACFRHSISQKCRIPKFVYSTASHRGSE